MTWIIDRAAEESTACRTRCPLPCRPYLCTRILILASAVFFMHGNQSGSLFEAHDVISKVIGGRNTVLCAGSTEYAHVCA